MPLTATQRGVIGQTEVAKLCMIGSRGELELAYPATDDDHRDIETHRRGHFVALPIQVKTTWRFWTHRLSLVIQIPFRVPARSLVSSPHFWYFFGFFDEDTMEFRDPVFLVPSHEVHKHAQPRLIGGHWYFMFAASLKPGAKDKWSRWRVQRADVGRRLLEILRTLERRKAAASLTGRGLQRVGDGIIWVRARRGRSGSRPARSTRG